MQVEEEDGYYSWAIGRQHLAVPLHSDYRWLDETDSAQEMSEPPAFSKSKPQELVRVIHSQPPGCVEDGWPI